MCYVCRTCGTTLGYIFVQSLPQCKKIAYIQTKKRLTVRNSWGILPSIIYPISIGLSGRDGKSSWSVSDLEMTTYLDVAIASLMLHRGLSETYASFDLMGAVFQVETGVYE